MARSVSYASGSVYIEYAHVDYGDEEDNYSFDCDVDYFRNQLKTAFKSVNGVDFWIDREDHVVAENSFAQFGISEYGDVVSIWCVPVEPSYYNDGGWENLRDNWIGQIENNFVKIARSSFGTPIIKIGTFSNGEAVFRALA